MPISKMVLVNLYDIEIFILPLVINKPCNNFFQKVLNYLKLVLNSNFGLIQLYLWYNNLNIPLSSILKIRKYNNYFDIYKAHNKNEYFYFKMIYQT